MGKQKQTQKQTLQQTQKQRHGHKQNININMIITKNIHTIMENTNKHITKPFNKKLKTNTNKQ